MNKHDTSLFTFDFDMDNKVLDNTRGNATLDYIFMTRGISEQYKQAEVGDAIGRSDHNIIICDPKKNFIEKGKLKTFRDFNKRNIDIAKTKLEGTDWTTLYRTIDVNEKLSTFYEALNNATSHIPETSAIIKSNDKPWITVPIKNKIQQRWRAYKAGDYPRYHTLKREIKVDIKTAKDRWANRVKTKAKSIWTPVNILINKKQGPSPFFEDNNLEEFFHEKFQQIFSAESNYSLNSQADNFPESIILTTPEEVHKLLKNININKSQGPDNIPNIFYKTTADFLCQPLCNIFNLCIQSGIYPETWKESVIVPIPKTTPTSKHEVRPISLLSTPGKILERLIIKPIKDKLENNFGTAQYGYKTSSSAVCALIAMQERIVRELDKTTTRNVLLLTLDFSKAFDKVHHDTLLKKLIDIIPKQTYDIIKSYIQNRSYKVKLDNKIGNKRSKIISSVPQGSILGPLLWCVYCKELEIQSNDIQTVKYADDTSFIITISKDDTNPEEKIQNVLKAAEEWSNLNYMTLNKTKTKIMNISFSPNSWKPQTNLVTQLNFCVSLKLLGITFCNNLSFKKHTENTIKACSSRLKALRMIREVLTTDESKLLFQSMIQSVVEYGAPVFFRMPAALKNKLQTLYKRGHRITCGANCDCDIEVTRRFDSLSYSLFLKAHNNTNHVLNCILPNFNTNSKRFILNPNRTNRTANSFSTVNAIAFNFNT